MDKAHNQSELLLSRLTRRITARYRKAEKQLIALPLDSLVLDDSDATATQRLKWAKQHGLTQLVEQATNLIVDATESAWVDMGPTFEEVYKLNFRYERDWFLERTGIDIGGEE